MSGREVRSLSRDEWTGILQKRMQTQAISLCGKRGKISLLTILQVEKPFTVPCGGGRKKIADAGYRWLQVALAGEYFWLTAIFDERDHFLELYVDMTDGNTVEADRAYFTDSYLDFVLSEEGVEERDKQELVKAFREGVIDREEYERTLAEGERVFAFLREHRVEVIAWLKKEYGRMKYAES